VNFWCDGNEYQTENNHASTRIHIKLAAAKNQGQNQQFCDGK
jgi:hypothetical protein